jgi:hypothetical protein
MFPSQYEVHVMHYELYKIMKPIDGQANALVQIKRVRFLFQHVQVLVFESQQISPRPTRVLEFFCIQYFSASSSRVDTTSRSISSGFVRFSVVMLSMDFEEKKNLDQIP